ncbi:MAG TPA: HEAT repeat domain-containing protein [Polyangia bacterium]|nr:HEAT repeat domain-containing protein [Polyangia bacterium]
MDTGKAETRVIQETRARLGSPDEEVRRSAIAALPPGWLPGAVALLVDAMGDGSWRVRKEAVARLAQWPDPAGAVPALIAALSEDANVGLRNAAVEALAAIGKPAVVPLLTALRAGGEHRKLIVDALGAIGDPQAVEPLCTAMEGSDENLRAAAAEALGRIGGPRVADALVSALHHEDLMTRLAALESLARIGAQVPLERIRPLLDVPILRRAAVLALGQSGSAEALPYLLDALADRTRGVREAAAVALTRLSANAPTGEILRLDTVLARLPADVIADLVQLLEAEDRAVRRAAATLLGWSRAPQALPALAATLRDDQVHHAAAHAIASFGPAAVAPLCALAAEADADLRPMLYDLFPRLHAAAADARVGALLARALEQGETEDASAAARALGEVGGKEALAPLFHAIERGENELATAAAGALGRLGARYSDEVRMLVAARGLHGPTAPYLCRVLGAIGRPEDRALLLGALKDESADLRRAAAEALPSLAPDPDALAALLFALADESAPVRAAAARGLGAIGDAQAVDALVSAAADPEAAVRAAAVRSLGQIGDSRARGTLRELASRDHGAVAAHAMEALRRLGMSGDEQVLLGGLSHHDPEVVKAALRGLFRRPSGDAFTGLVRALAHPRWDVRKLAVESLGERGDARARGPLMARRAVEADELVLSAIEHALEALPATGTEGGASL